MSNKQTTTRVIRTRVKTPPPHIDLRPLAEKVNTRMIEIYSSVTLTEDVRYLQANGIPISVIARRLGIDRELIYSWMRGVPTKNPMYVMLIREWASELRAKIQERDKGDIEAVAHRFNRQLGPHPERVDCGYESE